MEKNQILITSGTDYKRMTKELLERTDLKSHIKDRDKKIGTRRIWFLPSEASWVQRHIRRWLQVLLNI